MKKRQLMQTYGRHRQRVVSVDLWSSPATSVFSSSNDSLLSHSGNTSSSSSSVNSRGSNDKSRKDGNISWLESSGNTKVKRTAHCTRNTKKYLDDSSENLHLEKSQNNLKNMRPALRERTNIKKVDYSENLTKSSKKVLNRTNRKTRNTTADQTRAQKSRNSKVEQDSVINKKKENNPPETTELSHNFSDFERYSLLVESPHADRISPEVCELPGDESVHLERIMRSGTVTSTPHTEHEGGVNNRVLRSQHKQSALTSTPHTQNHGKLYSGISSRRNHSLRASISGQHSLSDFDPHCEVNECTENLEHLHLSGMSSIAVSPCNPQTQGDSVPVTVVSRTPSTVLHNTHPVLKHCTVSLQKLRIKTNILEGSTPGHNGHVPKASNSQSPLLCSKPDLSFTPDARITRSASKRSQLNCNHDKGSLRYSLLHSIIEYGEENTSRVSSTDHHSQNDQFYSCSSSTSSSSKLPVASNGKNSTYTLEAGGSFSHDPSQDLFDSVSHHTSMNNISTRKAAPVGLSSIREVSQRLQSMCIHTGQKVESGCKRMTGHGASMAEAAVSECVSLYSLTSDEDLSDLEEEDEAQEGNGVDSLYMLASDEELSVITEEEEAAERNQPQYNDSCIDQNIDSNCSESETSSSETEENETEQGETDQSETSANEENSAESGDEDVEEVINVTWSDDNSMYLTASQSETALGNGTVNSIGSKIKNSSYNTPKRQNTLQTKQLHQCCDSLKALTPVRCRKSCHTLSAREKVLLKCNQMEPIGFNQAITQSMMKKCVKIGEGVYGEVFKTERNKQSVALKVIPIEGDFEVNDEPQKTFEEMLPEIVISKELCALKDTEENMTSNFVEVKRVSVVQGSFPPQLLRQWDIFHQKKGSENDRPDMFSEDQLFIVFEFEECGCDLEGFKFDSLIQAKSVLLQVACAFAVAETALQFEHRDLHWGNVLVKRTKQECLTYTLAGDCFEVETCGVKVSIIDFTLSRLSKDGCEVFCDLSSDPTLFVGQGDYQFEIYRLMKDENQNDWKKFHPYTNVLWIHYLADKLLKGKSYSNIASKEHKLMSRQFRNFLRDALDYQSALHLMKSCSFFNES